MSGQFLPLEPGEVISINQSDEVLVSHTTFKVDEFIQALKDSYSFGEEEVAERWTKKGVPCEVLSPSKGWRKGKLKVSLVFCPDKPESPLDDIRQIETENV